MDERAVGEGEEGFDEWLQSPLGQYVAAREQAIFDRVVPDLFGFYALQMGAPGLPLLRASRVTHRFALAWEGPVDVWAECDQLPFADDQFDVIVLPHTLELQPWPHEVLREAYRVLRPEGRVLLSGFNPYSLFGLKRYFGRERRGPWGHEFISLARARDWLRVLGFDMVDGQFDCYNLPARRERTLQRLAALERYGDRWWPFAGGLYFLHAVKRVAGVRLIRPDWARAGRRRRAVQVVPSPTRQQRTLHDEECH